MYTLIKTFEFGLLLKEARPSVTRHQQKLLDGGIFQS